MRTCVLCAAPILPWRHVGGDDVRLSWLQEARGVHLSPPPLDDDNARPTGVGYLEAADHPIFFAPSDPEASYRQEGQPRHAYHNDEAFPLVHAACWDILRAHAPRGDHVALHRRLAPLLYCTYRDAFGVPDYVQRLPGTSPSWHTALQGLPGPSPYSIDVQYRRALAPPWRFLTSDPKESYAVRHLVQMYSSRQGETSSPSTNHVEEGEIMLDAIPGDPFIDLPLEILHMIFQSLGSKDLCNLRLASKVIAPVTHTDRLPTSFWRSRFLGAGDDMALFLGGVIPALPAEVDARGLYMHLRNELVSGGDLHHLRSRWRIYRTLQHVLEPMYALEGYSPRYAFVDSHSSAELDDWARSHALLPGPLVRSQRYNQIGPPHEMVRFPCGAVRLEPGHLEVTASFLKVGGIRYLCGFRMRPIRLRQSGGDESRVDEAGLLNMADVEIMEIPCAEAVVEVDVYTRTDGVVGLNFRMQNVQSAPGEYIGETKERELGLTAGSSDVGVATLKNKEEGDFVAGLAFMFDAFKCTAVQVLQRREASLDGADPPTAPHERHLLTATPETVWRPFPPPGPTSIFPLTKHRPPSGADAWKKNMSPIVHNVNALGHVVGVAAAVGYKDKPITGLMLRYVPGIPDDGLSWPAGGESHKEQVFRMGLDESDFRGEYITRIELLYHDTQAERALLGPEWRRQTIHPSVADEHARVAAAGVGLARQWRVLNATLAPLEQEAERVRAGGLSARAEHRDLLAQGVAPEDERVRRLEGEMREFEGLRKENLARKSAVRSGIIRRYREHVVQSARKIYLECLSRERSLGTVPGSRQGDVVRAVRIYTTLGRHATFGPQVLGHNEDEDFRHPHRTLEPPPGNVISEIFIKRTDWLGCIEDLGISYEPLFPADDIVAGLSRERRPSSSDDGSSDASDEEGF